MMNKELIKKQARLELARRDFFFYCHIKAPNFYRKDRKFLVDMCEQMQEFLHSDEEVLIINEPPRHGKSRTGQCFVEWVLGNDHSQKIMTGGYNEKLSTQFAKGVRNTIQEEKADAERIVYTDIFPNTAIKHGDGAMNMWSLEDGYNNYLATSPTGTATGFGATLMIIDDVIKNAEEANNADVKEKHWEWFTNTMLSRLEEGGKIIIIMTRWASDDLAGRALEHFNEIGMKVRHINMRAIQEDGSMLCSEILSYKSAMNKKATMGADIFNANYQQEPIDIKGRLYSSFKTYDGLLPQFKSIKNYTDTADTGSDYLCSIVYGVTFANEAYVLDVIYTKEPMEITEPLVAEQLYNFNVNDADIESNNGGRGFARNVNNLLWDKYQSNRTYINPFTQSKNKIARILSNATWVMKHVYFPKDWKNRWSDYYDAMIKYQREGKNAHDDAPDATTGIAEMIQGGNTIDFD